MELQASSLAKIVTKSARKDSLELVQSATRTVRTMEVSDHLPSQVKMISMVTTKTKSKRMDLFQECQ